MSDETRESRSGAASKAVLGPLVLLTVSVALMIGSAACGSANRPERTTSQPEQTSRIMVTLPTTSKLLVRRAIEELMVAYELRFVASWEMRALGVQCVVFEVPMRVSRARIVRSLEVDHRVDMAQAVSRFVVQGGGPVSGSQARSYRHLQTAADALHLDGAHHRATGRGVKLAVIDTGADMNHPEFGHRVAVTRNFAERRTDSFATDPHGTAVAGLIAADHRDEVGIVGVAPEVELHLLKACWPEPEGGRRAVCDSYTLALALDFAVTEGAQVINLSLGGPEEPILRRLIEEALGRGIVVVAAWPREPPRFPASMDGVLSVRALGSARDLLRPQPAEPGVLEPLAAPGEEILTTTPGGGYDFWSGSSMAAAQVAGVVALVLEHRPDMSPADMADLLRSSARDNPGRFVVDACAAVARLFNEECR